MPFDIQLVISALDFKGFSYSDHPDLSVLRARYPELGFVFDRLEDKTSEADNAAIEHRDEMREREHNNHIDELEARIEDLRLALFQIKELTVDAEITNIIEEAL